MTLAPVPPLSPAARNSQRRRQGVVLGLLAMTVISVAGAQTRARAGTTATQRTIAIAGTSTLANDGVAFQLICRGGAGLRVSASDVRPMSSGSFVPTWTLVATLTVDFNRTQSLDPSGRNLQPGQCGPAGVQLRDVDPTQIRNTISAGNDWQKSAEYAERYPNSDNVPEYLKNPSHYWSFTVADSGEGYFVSKDSRYWRPRDYKGPAASATYQPAATAAAMAGASATTVQATTSRYGGTGIRTEGHAGTPAVPSPATPERPIEGVPALPIVFSPPLLQDGEQLWACMDAAAGEADAGACSGEASAQAYCRLRDAQSAPDLLIADAEPGVPVRAVNGDVCAGETCRVISQLQCDR